MYQMILDINVWPGILDRNICLVSLGDIRYKINVPREYWTYRCANNTGYKSVPHGCTHTYTHTHTHTHTHTQCIATPNHIKFIHHHRHAQMYMHPATCANSTPSYKYTHLQLIVLSSIFSTSITCHDGCHGTCSIPNIF